MKYDTFPSPREKEALAKNEHGLTTFMTSTMIVTYTVGLGVLSLPYVVSMLGWLPFACIFILFLGSWGMSSSLYIRLYASMPSARTLPGLASTAFGAGGAAFVGVVQMTFIVCFATILHLTAAISIKDIVHEIVGRSTFTEFSASIVAGAALLLLLQARNVRAMGHMSFVGAATIIMPCIILLVCCFVHGRPDSATTELVGHNEWARSIAAFMNILFSFSGQHVFIELQAQSERPALFPRAVAGATVCIVIMYSVLPAGCYFFLGKQMLSSGDPVTRFITDPRVLLVVNVFLLMHVAVGYFINGHVFATNLLHAISSVLQPKSKSDAPLSHRSIELAKTDIDGSARQGVLARFLATLLFVGITFSVSNVVPFFSDLMSVIASLLLTLLTFTIPIALALRLLDFTKSEVIMYTALGTLSVVAAVVGVAASFVNIVEDWKHTHPAHV